MDDELRRSLQRLTDDVAPVSPSEARARANQSRSRPVSQVPLIMVLVAFVLVIGGLTARAVRTAGPDAQIDQSTGDQHADTSTTTSPGMTAAPPRPDEVITDDSTTTAPPTPSTSRVTVRPTVTTSRIAVPPDTTAPDPEADPPATPPPMLTTTTSFTPAPVAPGVVLRGDGLGVAAFGQDNDTAFAALDTAFTSPGYPDGIATSAGTAFFKTYDSGFVDEVANGLVRTVSWGTDPGHPAVTVQFLQRTSGTGPSGFVWWKYTPVEHFPALRTAAGLAPPTTRTSLSAMVSVQDQSDPKIDRPYPCFTDRKGTICAIPAAPPADPNVLSFFLAGTSPLDREVSAQPVP